MIFALCLVILISCYIMVKMRFRELSEHVEEMPGDKAYPLIGNFYPYMKIHTLLDSWIVTRGMIENYIEHGIMKIWFGPIPFVVIWDPYYLEMVVNSPHTANKGNLYRLIFGYLSDGVFIDSGGTRWKELRKPLNKSMAKKYMDSDYLKTFSRRSKELKEYIKKYKLGKYDDVMDDVSSLIMDIFCDTHVGVDINEIQQRKWRYAHLIDEYLSITVTAILKYYFYIWQVVVQFSSLGTKIKANKKKIMSFLQYVFDERVKCNRAKEGSHEFYTDFLLRRGQEKKLPKETLYKELGDVITAGADTTSVSLSAVLLYLAMFPEHQEEAFREQVDIFGDSDNDPTPDDLSRMVFLERIIKETIRLHAPPAVARVCEANLKLGRYTAPKGAVLYVPHHVLHRDPRYWERPHNFYPDHFLPEKEKRRPRYSYVPFGWGPRICPGFQYSNAMSKVAISTLLRSFRLTTEIKFQDIVHDYKLMMSIRGGYLVKFESR